MTKCLKIHCTRTAESSWLVWTLLDAPCFPDCSKGEGQLVNIWAFKNKRPRFPNSPFFSLPTVLDPTKFLVLSWCFDICLVSPVYWGQVRTDLEKCCLPNSCQISALRSYFQKHCFHWPQSHFSCKKTSHCVFSLKYCS